MRADAVIHAFPIITVHAQYLVTRRKTVSRQPVIGMVASRIALLVTFVNSLSESRTVIVNVIDREKLALSLATTGADISTVGCKCGFAHTLAFGLSVYLSFCKILGVVSKKSIFRPRFCAFLAFGHGRLIAGLNVKLSLVFRLTTFCASFHKTLVRYCHAAFAV
mgnify:CR=1 FL=1